MRKLKESSGDRSDKGWLETGAPDGNINNCALANGAEEKSCQMCKGTCPDRDRFIAPPIQRGPEETSSTCAGCNTVEENRAKTDNGFRIPWGWEIVGSGNAVKIYCERCRKNLESVEDVSKKLAQTMEDAEKEAKLSAARAAVFENPYAAKEHPMPTPMRRIVEHHFDDDETDIAVEHKALEKLLDSSERVGHQSNALEQAETNARRAMKLYLRFRQARFEWEQDNKVVFSSMRIEATKALQAEKQSGTRSKQITDADVETMCASLFPDEMRAQEVRRNKAHLTEKSLEHLVEVWSSKCRSLNALVGKGR